MGHGLFGAAEGVKAHVPPSLPLKSALAHLLAMQLSPYECKAYQVWWQAEHWGWVGWVACHHGKFGATKGGGGACAPNLPLAPHSCPSLGHATTSIWVQTMPVFVAR